MKRALMLFTVLFLFANPPWTSDVQVSQDTGTGNQDETTMGIFEDTLICGGWNDNRTGTWHVGFAASYDGGVTWQETLMYEPSYPGDCDPCIVVNDSGHICYIWLSYDAYSSVGDVYFTKSRDWGVTWDTSICVTPGSPSSLDDKPWAAVDGNNVFVTWRDFYDDGVLQFKRSTDWGETWGTEKDVGNYGNGSMPFRGTDSIIYVGCGAQDLRLNKSTDMGTTWLGQQKIIDVVWDPPVTPYRINNIPCFGTNQNRDTLYAVFSDSRLGADQLDVFFSKSTDQGVNWISPVKINDTPSGDTTLQFYPWMAVDPDDRIHVVWHDTREGSRYEIAQYYAYSTDGGSTWSTNQRVSDTVAYTDIFIGDYTASAADSQYVYALWCDCRNGSNNPDIFFSKRLIELPGAPSSPNIFCTKSGSDAILTWNTITTDTLGNPLTVDYYAIYRSTTPSFVPSASDSIGYADHPETTFNDFGALAAGEDYHYLVKAVDEFGNKSKKSNMAYVFNKLVNENTAATNKNWVSLPWHSPYDTVSDLTDDLSSSGDPLTKITNLRDDQLFESWSFTTIPFPRWTGTNFNIIPGRAYEMVTIKDTTMILVGSNNPDGEVSLNENAGATDKNWVSIPYNAVYSSTEDITDEYSPSGNPLTKLTNLRDDQLFESWSYTTVPFPRWTGTNFGIEPGRGYEFVTISDTTWNPTEYSNEAFLGQMVSNINAHVSDGQVHIGTLTEPDRTPLWLASNDKYVPATLNARDDYREAGVSHLVRGYFELTGRDNIVFTAYRPDRPYDLLTENMVGSGFAMDDEFALFWFDVGNFKSPWQADDEVILVLGASQNGTWSFTHLDFSLDKNVDIQELGKLTFAHTTQGPQGVSNENIPITYAFSISPNPFTKLAHLDYVLPKQTSVEIVIYDVSGRKVAKLVSETQKPGYYTTLWNGTDDIGRKVSSGIYFVRFGAGEFKIQDKILLVK